MLKTRSQCRLTSNQNLLGRDRLQALEEQTKVREGQKPVQPPVP